MPRSEGDRPPPEVDRTVREDAAKVIALIEEVERDPQAAQRRLDRLVGARMLELITVSENRGFRLELALDLLEQAARNPDQPSQLGYTVIWTDPAGRRKSIATIRVNPLHLALMDERSLPGFFWHEAFHHAPEVHRLQDMMLKDLGNLTIVPAEIQDEPRLVEAFFDALQRSLQNGLADVWLECWASRIAPIHADLLALNANPETPEEWAHQAAIYARLPLAEQLVQLIVSDAYRARTGPDLSDPLRHPIDDLVDPRVAQAYTKLKAAGAMDAIQEIGPIGQYFATATTEDEAYRRKFAAYRDHYLPAFIELIRLEVTDRAPDEDQQPKPGDGQEARKRQLNPAQKRALQALLDGMAERGQEQFASHFPSEELEAMAEEAADKIARAVARTEARLAGKEVEEEDRPPLPPTEPDPHAELARLRRQLSREGAADRSRGLGEDYGVTPEAITTWEAILEARTELITTLAAQIAEVFLADRRDREVMGKREGLTIPGLEYEEWAAIEDGDPDPPTKFLTERFPDFIETEIVFIVDKSGSMDQNLQQSMEAVIVLTEACRQVRETLAQEDLLDPHSEQPLRVGCVTFDSQGYLIKDLASPLDNRAEAKIVQALSRAGGGTDDYPTIKREYEALKLHQKHILKIIVVFSDGYGDMAAVSELVKQIEEDDEVLFLVAGLGPGAEGVVRAYTSALRQPVGDTTAGTEVASPGPNVAGLPTNEVVAYSGNVFTYVGKDVETLAPAVAAFFQSKVKEHNTRYRESQGYY